MSEVAMGEGGRSLEDILAAVEKDEGLRGEVQQRREAAQERSGEDTEAMGGVPPELLSKLPLLLKALNGMTAPLPRERGRPETPEALLCALRPYLNERRRQVIDAMIRISRIGGMLGSLQG